MPSALQHGQAGSPGIGEVEVLDPVLALLEVVEGEDDDLLVPLYR